MTSTRTLSSDKRPPVGVPAGEALALVVAWCPEEPHRVGEIALVTAGRPMVLGRGDEREEGRARLHPGRQRPGRAESTGPLAAPRLSRSQLVLERDGDTLAVENVGRAPMRVNGREVAAATVVAGDVIEVHNRLVLFVARRPTRLDVPPGVQIAHHPFGEADDHGFVGESPAAWALRTRVAFAAGRPAHVLVTGPSGAGKELVARALHALSPRSGRPMVSRNAATFPATLIDAELFGNVRDYPNPGMRERPGLVGEADGSTLFLDEIGELPPEMQAHLLRVLDAGEYQRLGEARTRSADVRVIAATNRDPALLKHDFLARLQLRIAVPDLSDRREDVPLLVRHLLRRIARSDRTVAARWFPEADARGEPRVSAALVVEALRGDWPGNVRDLEAWLWEAMASSPGDVLEPPPGRSTPVPPAPPREITAEALREAMERHGGVLERVWRELGLRNRFQLRRLLQKHGLA